MVPKKKRSHGRIAIILNYVVCSVVNVKVIVYVVLKGEMAKETKVQKGKRSNATSKDGPIRGRKGGVTEKKVSVGKKIRDVKRLLSKVCYVAII